ncbi:aldo/keto reductase [Motiliproteus sediminis]|uniref:aldo/keto reductase n=1 Tax=Motiliproteus sediminis TaxID=1468178 RepID=UPI001AEFC517|nr:aldo/keto reductase [Motiliproteus sediminis]
MRTVSLGPFTVSAIGLGCMNMSAGYGPADQATSEKLLHAALDRGYRFLDTAAIYGFGDNEKLIGRTLAARRDQYVLATKCGMTRDQQGLPRPSGRPERLQRECEQSLRNLQTEVIDLYYLHRVDPDVPVEESVGALGELVRQGKVRTIGLSEVCCDTLRRAHQEFPITAVQSEYSLWSRTAERGMLTTCEELGVTFVPFSPLARGFLTGKASDVTTLSEGDIRQTIARPRFEPEAFARNSELLVPYRAIAERIECSPAQLALAWLLAKTGGKVVPIPGTKHIDFMEENAGAVEVVLDDATVIELDALINDDTVSGARYADAVMDSIDSERD